MIGLLMFVLTAAGAEGASLELRRDPDGMPVVDSAYTETVEYQIKFKPSPGLSASERLDRLIGPEPYEVVREDVDAATATVRLGKAGAFAIVDPPSWQHLGILSISPEPPRTLPPTCQQIFISLPLSDGKEALSETGQEEAVCPRSTVADGLVIEAVDKKGKRLWVAAAHDDRTTRSVMGPNGEPHGPPVRVDVPDLSALITVPSMSKVSRFRWYEVTDQRQLRKIGETRWRPENKK